MNEIVGHLNILVSGSKIPVLLDCQVAMLIYYIMENKINFLMHTDEFKIQNCYFNTNM